MSSYLLVTGTATTDNELVKSATATCTGGRKVVGGGYTAENVSSLSAIAVTASYASSDTVWTVTGDVTSTSGDTSFSLRAYAICVLAP